MALRGGCFRIDWLARLATAALISASILCLAGVGRGAPRPSLSPLRARGPVGAHVRYTHAAYATSASRTRSAISDATAPRLRSRRRAVAASPAFSALVVDANSGRTLYAVDENGLRHPASITKVMTLYLLFEQLDRGAMTLQTPIPISEHAAAQEPSKLGLPPGDTISVDDAIKAIVTRSANDVAVAIAEAVGGDGKQFRRDDDAQGARARHGEHALSQRLRPAQRRADHHGARSRRSSGARSRSASRATSNISRPPSSTIAGEIIGNHNHLLGRVDGVDGIKTGYTRASGFNLLTSVHRDGRSLIAVVMGGRSAGGRDRIMENLIADHIAEASTARTATMVAEAAPAADGRARAPSRPRRRRSRARRRSRSPRPSFERVSAATQRAKAGEGDDDGRRRRRPAPQSS